MTRVLFILKRRPDFDPVTHAHRMLSTGLYNSARLVQEMLVAAGIAAEIEVAIDNNCIDRLVTQHRPTHVIIEALWVVPTKFDILQKLHPTVKWILRMHSETPFIANEGIAMDWLFEYTNYRNLYIGINAPRFLNEIQAIARIKNEWSEEELNDRIFYMPNFYPASFKTKTLDQTRDTIDIACFGAIRPLKNHLVQAIAAIRFADKLGKRLRFHVNSGRIEMKGQPVVHNLQALFQHMHECGHEMVAHEWMPHDEFLQVCATIDIGLQVSFSETFNIVGADLISEGIPVVGSTEIPWAATSFCADPTNSDDIVGKLERTWSMSNHCVRENQLNIDKYSKKTQEIWVDLFTRKSWDTNITNT